MSDYDNHKVLSFACPHCKAEPGERCRAKANKALSNPHMLRKGLAYPRFMQSPRKNQLRNRVKDKT